jgi:hypothetical protein
VSTGCDDEIRQTLNRSNGSSKALRSFGKFSSSFALRIVRPMVPRFVECSANATMAFNARLTDHDMHKNTLRGDTLENILHVRPQALEGRVVSLELEFFEDLNDYVQPARGLNHELLRLLFVRFDSLFS